MPDNARQEVNIKIKPSINMAQAVPPSKVCIPNLYTIRAKAVMGIIIMTKAGNNANPYLTLDAFRKTTKVSKAKAASN